VFISYSHNDQQALDELMMMLGPEKEKYNFWFDRDIQPGAKWQEEIRQNLDAARAAILLVGPAFLMSDFIRNKELPPLLKAASEGGCRILWIQLQECLVERSAISEYQALYKGALMNLPAAERNTALAQIAGKILDILEDKQAGK
jgi:hypothetical protein